MKHIMVDLETFSTKPYATILSIGAVWFDPNEPGRILDTFYATIDPVASQKLGFRMDAETVCWWLQAAQRPAWEEWSAAMQFEPQEAISGFSMWLDSLDLSGEGRDARDRAIWGNGATFDNVLLRQAFEVLNLEVPWKHYNDRCFRTFKKFPRAQDVQPPFHGTTHNALDDALHQAKWLQNIIREYNLSI